MEKIWANRLIAGTKTWIDVPDRRKNGIKAELIRRIENGDLLPERYTEITSEEYIIPEKN